MGRDFKPKRRAARAKATQQRMSSAIQRKRFLTFGGHIARMQPKQWAFRVMLHRNLTEWRIRQSATRAGELTRSVIGASASSLAHGKSLWSRPSRGTATKRSARDSGSPQIDGTLRKTGTIGKGSL